MSPNRETEMDTSIDATPQMSLLKRIEDVESRTEAALGPFRELGRYLTNQSEDFLGQSTIDGCGATGVQPDKALEVPRILLDTDRRKIQAMVIMLMNLLQFPIDDRWPYPQLQTTILMAIHGPEGKTIMRVAKLDTGSWHNVISRKLTSSIGLKLEKYTGRAIQPLGQEISPKNQVTFSWHVSGRPLSYKTTFAVIETEWQENLEFDILLGIYEIQRVGFYLQNQAVFYIQ
ncbi:MAG: hypothetical protein L6R41_003828 [Letrouitia leprolyta]|nr:MAG: hypothetical protein L6R41_003828 [Letrouitia leprolyta]